MAEQSEPEIEELRKRLQELDSQGLEINSASKLEEYFKSLHRHGGAKDEAQKIEDSLGSPLDAKNWSYFTPSVSVVSMGATGVGVSMAVIDIMGTVCLNTADIAVGDASAFDYSIFAAVRKRVDAKAMDMVADHLIACAKGKEQGAQVREEENVDLDISSLYIEGE